MKRVYSILSILILAGSGLLIASCGKDSTAGPALPDDSVNVIVAPEQFNIGPETGNYEMSVKAGADWAVRTDADWISIRPSGGIRDKETKVQISVKNNAETDFRHAAIDIVSGGKVIKSVSLTQGYVEQASVSSNSLVVGGGESSASLLVSANAAWSISSDASWISIAPDKGEKGETTVQINATANPLDEERVAKLTLKCGSSTTEIKFTQLNENIIVPKGYTLVWADEFNGSTIGNDWKFENWPAGYVNNELQIYTSSKIDGKSTAQLKDGFLNITCFKATDGKIYSARMNACPSTGWLYGYFEARIMLPKGKGTWPAFWMMPCNVNWSTNPWPKCGEIDIMEEVGANPNYVSSSLHTEKYNHTKNTQITHEMKCEGAEESFHVYALEWTPDEIISYVDGKVQLRASKAALGADHDCWPFHYAFYPILNLAWGGDWGGYKGVDDSALPATMKVDYVRIFQKK